MAAKKRYEIGLQKLAFTEQQVVVMQDELTALKPNLIRTVAETERLMATVQKEKTEVRTLGVDVGCGRGKVLTHAWSPGQQTWITCTDPCTHRLPSPKRPL